jgi:hypothetical protein
MANGAGRRSKKCERKFWFYFCNTRNRVGCPCCFSKYCIRVWVPLLLLALHPYVPPADYKPPPFLPYTLTFLQLITNLRQLVLHPYVPRSDRKPPSACLTSLSSAN